MARPTVFTALLVTIAIGAIGSFGQVVVTSSGFATTPGPAIPATPASPPILYTPIVQLGQGQTQPVQTDATTYGIFPPAEEVVQSPAPPVVVQLIPATNNAQPVRSAFNFGVARFDSSFGGVGGDINGKALGDIARERREHPSGANARVYSNNDIDKLNQGTPSSQANKTNDNWAPNNGVISPENSQPPQNSVGAPAQQNQSPTGTQNPPAPKLQNYNPAGIEATPNQPQSRPQSETRPFDKYEGIEIAQNNPPNAPLTQGQSENSSSQNAPAQNQPQASQLPHTASRLPLVGVAGLFSVSMGLFVRYQRSKGK